MPVYEYRCPECGERFEKLIRSSISAAEVRCPKCNADKVERQVSLFGFSAGSAGVSMSSASSCAPSGG